MADNFTEGIFPPQNYHARHLQNPALLTTTVVTCPVEYWTANTEAQAAVDNLIENTDLVLEHIVI